MSDLRAWYLDGGNDEAQYGLARVGLLHLELTPQGLEDPVHHPLHLDIKTHTQGSPSVRHLIRLRHVESVFLSTQVVFV